jgi:hypothetical protein
MMNSQTCWDRLTSIASVVLGSVIYADSLDWSRSMRALRVWAQEQAEVTGTD